MTDCFAHVNLLFVLIKLCMDSTKIARHRLLINACFVEHINHSKYLMENKTYAFARPNSANLSEYITSMSQVKLTGPLDVQFQYVCLFIDARTKNLEVQNIMIKDP
jgi:hypothetical protein